jgi:hypothetical protein
VPEPEIATDVTTAELSREARAELRTASKDAAEAVGLHLVMAGRLIDDDPDAAYAHADAARRRLPRLAVVREAVGLCAYATGRWAEALAELRASKRISGSIEHLPVMADCERGLGRPERALALASSPEAARLDRAGAVEMRIVVSGARRDLGQLDAAVVSLQGPDLDAKRRDPLSARLFYAYADALLTAGRIDEAREWFVTAALADVEGSTDAAERIDDIDANHRPQAVPAVSSAVPAVSAEPEAAQPASMAKVSASARGAGGGLTPEDAGAHAVEEDAQTELVLIFEEPPSS